MRQTPKCKNKNMKNKSNTGIRAGGLCRDAITFKPKLVSDRLLSKQPVSQALSRAIPWLTLMIDDIKSDRLLA